MEAFRKIIASALVSLFTLVALSATLAWSVLDTASAGPLKQAISASRAGERLPPMIVQALDLDFSKLPLTPKGFTSDELIDEAFPAAAVEAELYRFAYTNLSYIRGEAVTPTSIGLSAFLPGIKAAMGKHLPAAFGRLAANGIEEAVASAGSEGASVPKAQLDQARAYFRYARLGGEAGFAAMALLLMAIFLVTPKGIMDKLKNTGKALLMSGVWIALGAVAFPAIPGMVQKNLESGSAPPEAVAMAKDLVGSLLGSMSIRLYISAGILAALGILCFIIRVFLKPRPVQPLNARILPGDMRESRP
jgi:hypothetical protein